MKLLPRLALLAAVLLSACRASEQTRNQSQPAPAEAAVAPVLTTPDAVDTATYARPLEARVTHVALDLGVDFKAKRIGGTATLDIDRKPNAREIVLDDKGLQIDGVTDAAGKPLPWKVGTSDPNLGAPLTISLRPATRRIVIHYLSAPNATALPWLSPQQ